MNEKMMQSLLVVFALLLCTALPAHAYTAQELDYMLGPIALYPDPLLAQMLPASTYPDDLADEAAWLRNGGDIAQIDEQNWADSVKALAHYPGVLYMMADDMDWTLDLGDAFLNQPQDVTDSIQRLRRQAQEAGNLASSPQETVITDGDDIDIDPAQPQYIYVPQYDYRYVYSERWRPGMAPFITFGVGLAIGDWLSMDFDWHGHHVFYHGWNRPGWVSRSRPYVHITNVYVNRSRPFISETWRHDPSHGDPDSFRYRHGLPESGRDRPVSEVRGRGITTPASGSAGAFRPGGDVRAFSSRGRESLNAMRQGTAPGTAAVRPAEAPAQHPGGFAQSRPAGGPAAGTRQPPRAPSTVFGGYRGAQETRTESMRGQASRQSSAPAPHAGPAPAARSSSPAGGQSRGRR